MKLKNLVLISLLVGGCLACNHSTRTSPPELLGFWTTDAPAYKERYIKFESDYVLFGIGDDQSPTIQRISNIVTKPDGNRTIYIFDSHDSDGEHQLVISYDPSNGGSLQIKNQRDVVWKRFSSSSIQRPRNVPRSS